MLVVLQAYLRQESQSAAASLRIADGAGWIVEKRRLRNILGKITPLYIQRWWSCSWWCLTTKLDYVSYWKFLNKALRRAFAVSYLQCHHSDISVLIVFACQHNAAVKSTQFFFAFVINFTFVRATSFFFTFSDYSDYEDSSVEFLDRCSSPLTRSSGSSLTLRSMFSEKNTSYQYPRAILSVDLSGESRLNANFNL